MEDEHTFRAAITSAIDAPRLIPTARTSPESVRLVGSLIDATAGWSDRSSEGKLVGALLARVRL